jgi:sugar phosphate isomerase/epimerase
MFHHQTRRDWMKTAIVTAAGAAGLAGTVGAQESAKPGAASAPARAAETPLFPVYALDTGRRGPDVPTIEAQVALVKKLGYTGIDFGLGAQLPKQLEQLGQHGLQLWAVYLMPSLEGGLPAGLEESVRLMKGRPTRIELAIGSKQVKCSDPAGDAKAVEMIKRASDMAADTGPVISVYPHRGSWTERVDDGVRLARQVGRKNVGTNFNLVHWKWLPQTKSLEALLTEALPHLMTVTINGMAGDKIVPLDEGDYDVTEFMATVKKAGYRGPVGFQGYGIKGNSEEILSRTMKKWREIMAKISA